MTWSEVAATIFDGKYGLYIIRNALCRLGYKRYVACSKPLLTEATKRRRLEFAQQYIIWTYEQWRLIFWSDETWIKGGHHTKVYVTRRKDEELEEDCVLEKYQKKRGWMFWGCFNGGTKGPGVFWEKDWGTIGQETYC
jgi:hypothetical protein